MIVVELLFSILVMILSLTIFLINCNSHLMMASINIVRRFLNKKSFSPKVNVFFPRKSITVIVQYSKNHLMLVLISLSLTVYKRRATDDVTRVVIDASNLKSTHYCAHDCHSQGTVAVGTMIGLAQIKPDLSLMDET